jgi:hypothetical protein
MYNFFKCLLLPFAIYIGITTHTFTQVVWEHPSSKRIYDFLDEMATEQFIVVNSTIKPYTREFIGQQLLAVQTQENKLNQRQLKQLQLFLQEYALETSQSIQSKHSVFSKEDIYSTKFNPVAFYYRDSLFRLKITPIWGRTYHVKKDDYAYHNRGGASVVSYISDNIGVYANVRDNYIKNYVFGKPTYLTTYEGGNYKLNEGGRDGGDYSEMRGGITWSWKWGNLGLIKDHIEWGDNQNGANIFNAYVPSISMIKLNLQPTTWFDFNYFHGWLVSMVVDSNRSYITAKGDLRAVYRDKYIAANMFTVRPWQQLNVSIGNSIIYSDMTIHPAYLIPFMFYKSIDHTINKGIDNQNSQMFINISSRNVRKLHLYATYFIDEWSFKRINNPERRNFTSFKAGFQAHNILIDNTSICVEYTQTNPLTYKHRVPATTYTTNHFNIGHYLLDNARDLYAAVQWKPLARLQTQFSAGIAQKGNDYPYMRIPGQRVDEYPYLKDIIWQQKYAGIQINYYPVTNCRLHAAYTWSNISAKDADGLTAKHYLNLFSSPFLHGKNQIVEIGLSLGL